MMAYNVVMEIKGAKYDGTSGNLTVSVEYRLLDGAGTVAGTKTASVVLEDTMGSFDHKDFFDAQTSRALAWGAFMLGVNKITQAVGKTRQERLTN